MSDVAAMPILLPEPRLPRCWMRLPGACLTPIDVERHGFKDRLPAAVCNLGAKSRGTLVPVAPDPRPRDADANKAPCALSTSCYVVKLKILVRVPSGRFVRYNGTLPVPESNARGSFGELPHSGKEVTKRLRRTIQVAHTVSSGVPLSRVFILNCADRPSD